MPTLEGTFGGHIWRTSLNYSGTYLEFTDGSEIESAIYHVDTTTLSVGVRSLVGENEEPLGGNDTGTTRYYQEFDTSEISRVPASATFDPLLSDTNIDSAAIVCVETKFETDGALKEIDYANHLNLGHTHKTYTEILPAEQVPTIGDVGRKSMNFTQDGLDAIRDLDKLQMVCLEAEFDYTRTEPHRSLYPFIRYTTFLGEIGAGDFGTGPTLTYTMGEYNKHSSGTFNIKNGKVVIK